MVAAVRLTAAEATVRFLAAQFTEANGRVLPLFAGVWAIFGHGNVAGIGPALHAHRDILPTFRAHNEQAMALAAIAYAKQQRRRRMMACTTSVGPGATNMVTAAALAHVNRLPVLLLPGDIFASRRPDPVLQQIEQSSDPTVSANDCFRPVARYWDRISRPEQLLTSLPAAMRVLTDPAECGPAVICMPQDVQAESALFPAAFFRRRIRRTARPEPDRLALDEVATMLSRARRPLVIAGGGVKYAEAEAVLGRLAARRGIPVAETQAGKGSLAWTDAMNMGSIGVTGSTAANTLARASDLILAIGTRLADFTTGSRSLFPHAKLVTINSAGADAAKHDATPLVADAKAALLALERRLGEWRASGAWTRRAEELRDVWQTAVERATRAPRRHMSPPTDAQVLGAVNRQVGKNDVVVCASGGLPGELHKLWRASGPDGYHVEYGYSCMGYEIAGGLGAKLAAPDREVFVLVGDGSYLMMNSEIATSVAMRAKLTIVVLDNRGFGCINRLQKGTGGAPFNNLLADGSPEIDFVQHARSLGADAVLAGDIATLEAALAAARRARRTQVIVIATDPERSTAAGGHWWDVPVSDAPRSAAGTRAKRAYASGQRKQAAGG